LGLFAPPIEHGQSSDIPLVEGRIEVTLKLLALRFGHLPDAIQARIQSAQDAQIDVILERMLTAQTLQEALGC